MTPQKPSKRPFSALALEPRILLDAAMVATAADLAAQQVPATADAPGVEATPVNPTIEITDDTTQFPPLDLFKDVQVSTETGGDEELSQLVITVDRTGPNQALVIDGKTILLEAGQGLTRDDDGYVYSVTVSGQATTITVQLDAFDPSPESVKALIDDLAYQVQDNTVAGGAVTITLSSLSDTGQTADLNIEAVVTIESDVNVPPVLSGDILKEVDLLLAGSLAGATEVAYSADGRHVYVAGANDTITVFGVDAKTGRLTTLQSLSVENLGTVNHLVVSHADDNASVYSISGNGNLVQLSINDDGTLSHVKTVSVGSGSNGGLAISDDGKQVYVDASNNFGREVHIYDAITLDQIQRVESVRNSSIVTSGDYVYFIHSAALFFEKHSVKIFQRQPDGLLTQLDTIEAKKTGQNPVDYALTTSKDGRTLYVGDPTSKDITIYQYGDDGLLTMRNTIESDNIGSLTMSDDGKTLYAATTSGTVQLYAVGSAGSLTLAGSIAGSTKGGDIAVSPDGQNILVTGDGLARYSSIQALIRGSDIVFADGLSVSDANFDLLGDGDGNYAGGTLTVERQGGASNNDSFGFREGNDLSLDGQQIVKDGRAVASFTVKDGTLTIGFLEGSTKGDANAVLKQLTYANDAAGDPNGNVLTLALRAGDGKAESETVLINILLTNNTEPELTAEPIEHPAYDTGGVEIPLFKDAFVNPGEAGQSIIELTLSIDGVAEAANEFLIIDGVRIDLSQPSEGELSHGSYTYTVDGNGGKLVIQSATGLRPADAQVLINQIAYVNDSTEATTGTRTVTLASVTDNGGRANDGVDTSEPGIEATIELAINNAPQWQTEVTQPDPTLYYSDGTLEGYEERVTDIVVSEDGKFVVISGATGDNANGTSYLRVYARDTATGALDLVQSFTQGEPADATDALTTGNGFHAISSLVIHGTTLYVAGQVEGAEGTNYSLVRLDFNAAQGRFIQGGIVATQGVDGVTGLDAQISEIVISEDGKSLYTVNGVSTIDGSTGKSALNQFARDPATGDLTWLGSYERSDDTPGINAPAGLVVSPDGKSVYVANQSGSMLSVFSRDVDSGQLAFVGTLTADSIANDPDSGNQPDDNRYLQQLQDIVISPDGAYVYVASGSMGTISIFSRDAADGALRYVGTLDLLDAGLASPSAFSIREIALSNDGKALYIGINASSTLLVMHRDAQTGALSHADSVNLGGPLGNQIAVTPDGFNLYSGRSQFTSGLAVLSARPNVDYSGAQPNLPFSEGISFSDVDADAANDYSGTTLTIQRSGEASADDLFDFKSDKGLSRDGDLILRDGEPIADFVVSEGTVTITFTASVDQATVNQVLQQVSYRNTQAEAPARVDLTLTGSDGGKSAVATIALLLAADTPTEPGQEPSIGADPGSLDYRDLIDLMDDTGIGGLVGINGVTVIGDKVFVVASSDEHGSRILAFQRQQDGSLELVEQQEIADLTDTAALRASSDGSTLYVVGTGGVALFDATDLSPLGHIGDDIDMIRDVLPQGDVVYVTVNDSLQVYRRNGNELKLEQTLDDAGESGIQLDGAGTLALSPDGKTLFVGTSGGETLVSLFTVGEDGKLSFHQAVAGAEPSEFGHFVSTLSLAPDGKTLYVVDNQNVLHSFTVGDDSTLVPLTTVSFDEGQTIKQVVISPDGKTVALLGSFGNDDNWNTYGILLYARGSDGQLTQLEAIAGFGDIANYEGTTLNEVRQAAFSEDGKQLYLTGTFNYGTPEGLMVIDLKPAKVTFTEEGGGVALLPGGTLTDPQHDAEDDYGQAKIVIERDGGAHPGDVFGLLPDSDLQLDDGTIRQGERALASFTLAENGTLTVTFLAGTTQAEAQQVLRALSYDSTSHDPTQAGTDARFQVRFLDGDGNAAEMTVDLTLVDLNDAAEVSTTPRNPTFSAGGEQGKLFEDTKIDTIEKGQNIWKVLVSIDGVQAGDQLGVGDDNITDFESRIGQGVQKLDSGQEYLVLRGENGQIVLHLFVSGPADKAQSLVDSLSYGSSSDTPEGSRTIGLAVTEDVHWQHPDPNNATSTFEQTSTVTMGGSIPDSGKPEPDVKATGAQAELSLGTGTLPGPVDLFSDVTVLPGNDGEPLTALFITVNRSGPDQALIIDGKTVVLEATDMAATDSGYAYSITVDDDGTATIRVFLDASDANQPADVERLIDGLAYQVQSDAAEDGKVVVTLSGISDYDDGSLDIRAELDITRQPVEPDNQPPVLNPDVNLELGTPKAGQPYSVTLPADLFTDADGDTLTWKLIGLPEGLSFDPDTRTISGTPSTDGEFTVTIEVSDGEQSTAHEVKLVVAEADPVEPDNQPPVLNPDVSLDLGSPKAGQSYSVTLPADLFTDADGDTLTWKLIGLPEGLSFDPGTRTISGTPSADGEFTLTIEVSDGEQSANHEVKLIVAEADPVEPDNQPPVLNPDVSLELGAPKAGQPYSVTLPADLFTDADGDDLTWTLIGLPEGLSFDPSTRTISGTPSAAGEFTLIIEVSDGKQSASQPVTVIVAEATPPAPIDEVPVHLRPEVIGSVLSDAPGTALPVFMSGPDATPSGEATTLSLAPKTLNADGLLDQLLPPQWERDTTTHVRVQFVDGRTSPLVALAGPEGLALEARQTSVSGQWTRDPAGNRLILALPHDLIASRALVADLSLQAREGRLPAGLRLDLDTGRIILPGLQARSMDLQLVLRTTDGRSLSIPVHIDGRPVQPTAAAPMADADALAFSSKPDLSDQLRDGPAGKVLDEAQALLARLTQTGPSTPDADGAAPTTPARPSSLTSS